MKPRRSALSLFAAPSLVLVTLAVAGCAVQTEGPGTSENPTAGADKLTRPHCSPGQHLESSNETAGGKTIWFCVDDLSGPPPGPNPAACSQALPVPTALAGRGCFPGTFICLQGGAGYDGQKVPIFLCPSATVLPAALGFDITPVCSATLKQSCSEVWAFTSISNSCVSDAPDGWKYVSEAVIGHDDGIGGNCRGGCSSVPPPPPP